MNRILYIVAFSLLSLACSQEKKAQPMTTAEQPGFNTTPDTTSLVINSEHEKGGIKISPLGVSPNYRDARLVLQKPAPSAKLPSGTVDFDFRMLGESFELGKQTSDALNKGVVSQQEGQYIRLVLNGRKYESSTTASFSKELPDGHYEATAFLVRSYHESVKLATAKQVFQFTVGEATPKKANLAAPRLLYHQPQGDYVGEAAKKVVLDFYLLHTNISANGKKVKVTVNGTTEFILARWQPYVLEGLPAGKNKIVLELVDNKGVLFGGKQNRIEKTITIGAAQ